jgi:hypothetical protein
LHGFGLVVWLKDTGANTITLELQSDHS